jgi:hypothetical protein
MDGVHEKLLRFWNDLAGTDLTAWWSSVSADPMFGEFRVRALQFYSLCAMQSGRRDLLKLMLENGLNSNFDMCGEEPPIFFAIEPISKHGFSTVWMLKDLITYGANVNISNPANNFTPIWSAITKDALAHLVVLLEAGADPWRVVISDWGDAFEYCQKYKKFDHLSILREFI